MNGFDVRVVYPGLCLAERRENGDSPLFGRSADSRAADDLADLLEPSMPVLVLMRVGRLVVMMVMIMLAPVLMILGVAVRGLLFAPEFFPR